MCLILGMGRIGKTFALFLTLTVAMSCLTLLMVKPACAQSIPTPSVPEFTIKYVDNSYDVPPTYEINQYTGQNVTIQAGYHVENRTLVFTIKNQSFTPYNDSSGNHVALYYYFRYKGPYGNDWSYYPDLSRSYGPYVGVFPNVAASDSDYSIISIPLSSYINYPDDNPEIPVGAQAQFQVQTIIGYITTSENGWTAGNFYGFTGEKSDWSNTQTVTIGESTASTPIVTPNASVAPSQNPTAMPSQSGSQNTPLFTLGSEQIAAIVFVIVAVLTLAMALLLHRRSLTSAVQSNNKSWPINLNFCFLRVFIFLLRES